MQIARNKSLVLEYFNSETSVNNLTKAISDASPEQLARVEQIKAEDEQKRIEAALKQIKTKVGSSHKNAAMTMYGGLIAGLGEVSEADGLNGLSVFLCVVIGNECGLFCQNGGKTKKCDTISDT